jgi:hypothetical protein
MKNRGAILFCILISGIFISCQKKYDPDGVTVSGGSGTGTGGGTTAGSGTQLIKFTSSEAAGSSEYVYDYNSSGQLTKAVLTGIAGGQTIIYQWRFFRDVAGKLTQYSTKINIPGYPDSVLYTLHYPAGSAIFDYYTATYTFSGTVFKDSIVYTLSSGKVTKEDDYQNYTGTAYELTSSTSYTYDGNGNIATVDNYGDKGSGLEHAENYKYEYDNKSNALQLGQEAFLFYPNFISKNNYTKETLTNYSTSSSGVQTITNFAFQYNTLGKPVSSVASRPGSSATANQTYTYR